MSPNRPYWVDPSEPALALSRAPRFASVREAKQFLIDWIVAEARRLDVPLSEVERKMLYASSRGWTPPDMAEVQDAFDRYHVAVEYEIKMTNLIRIVRAGAMAGGSGAASDWQQAINNLRQEDHYLAQLIAASAGPIRRHPSRWRLVLTGLVILTAAFGLFWLSRTL